MPTPAARRARIVFWVSSIALMVCIGLFLFYGLQTRDQLRDAVAKVEQTNERLAAADRATAAKLFADCQRANIERARSNAQIRKPLKEMFAYFVTIVDQTLDQQFKTGKPIPNLTRTLRFREQFELFYRQVTLLKPLRCVMP